MRRAAATALTAASLASAALVGPAHQQAPPTQPAEIGTALFLDGPGRGRGIFPSRSKVRTAPPRATQPRVKPVKPVTRAVHRAAAPVLTASGVRGLGQALAAARGWTGAQWTCLNALWTRESNWRVTAANPDGAYGIPQALPGSKMGPGWQTSATVQIKWGLGYIASRYGTPCGAWQHSLATGWY